ncbi:MAG: FkbM family methyltransferase [Peptococcaceae bacterium]|jgi:FkbM family methyltransferase|nr:FkbM family methyltransferase [Peptococcaceae bacterium]
MSKNITPSLGQTIYNRLGDETSRRVFQARERFALTGDAAGFADVFVNKKLLAELERKIKGKTFVIYGGGFGGALLLRYLDLIGAADLCQGVWDNNPTLWGESLGKREITAPRYDRIAGADYFLISALKEQTTADITRALIANGAAASSIAALPGVGATLGRCGYEDAEQYFDPEIILPRLIDGEVFVDAGCCDFGTSAHLLRLAPRVKKIYAFEPDRENMPSVARRIARENAADITKAYDCALWSRDGELGFWISDLNKGASGVDAGKANTRVRGRRLDDIVDPSDNVSFIKMDIEGSELEALTGAAGIIRRDKPKLAICVYHKDDDYIDLPAYICSLVPSYQLYLRNYTPLNFETVLYCVT